MRRFVILFGGLLALVFAAAPANASGNTFHFSVKGPGAEAFFSTLPFDTEPTPGVTYIDTFVATGTNLVNFEGQKLSSTFLFIDEFSYMFDAGGNFIPVSDTFGDAEGSDVTLSLDARKLSSASVSATVDLMTCTAAGICSDVGPALVTASWTATGPKALQNGTFIFHTKGLTDVSHQHQFSRPATATAQVDGNDVPGSLQFADIFKATFKDVCIGTECQF